MERENTLPRTTRSAPIHQNGPDRWIVFFGIDRNGEFLSCRKPSRTYRTEKAAKKASDAWKALN